MITSEFKIISQSVPPRFDGFVIAHVSDLHNREFDGELIGKTSLVNPDIIVITGDMIHREDETDAAEKFALGAVQLAPVYYVTGNHEKVLSCYPAFADRLRDMGVKIMLNEYFIIERGGERIALIGMNDPVFFERGKTDFTVELNSLSYRAREEGAEYLVLLSHRPEMFPRYVSAGIDLSLCGHAHGGQVRIPFLGAIYAPSQGLFPRFTEGLYSRDGKSMVVSKGLGKSSALPRIFNPPELAVEILRRTQSE